jgi:hypothetical protein
MQLPHFLISGGLTALVLANPLLTARQATTLCSAKKKICVAETVAYSSISNPFQVDVRINDAPRSEVKWKVLDSTGAVLDSSSPYEYDTSTLSTAGLIHIRDFIFKPAASTTGTLLLQVSRDPDSFDDELRIPVQLATATTTVTTLEPQSPEALTFARNQWMDEETHHSPEFDPKLRLVPRRITIMRVDRAAAPIGVTAEAVLRLHPGQAQWHVREWRQEGSTAHIKIDGGGWAGVSSYLTEVRYLLNKSILNLPGVKKLVLEFSN